MLIYQTLPSKAQGWHPLGHYSFSRFHSPSGTADIVADYVVKAVLCIMGAQQGL